MQHLVKRTQCKDRCIRLHSCELIYLILSSLPPELSDLDDDLFQQVTTHVLTCSRDKHASVRAASIRALSRLQNEQEVLTCPVTSNIAFAVRHDESEDVRSAAVGTIHLHPEVTLPLLFAATADVSPKVRSAAYTRIRISVPFFAILPETRRDILQTGFTDAHESVRKEATLVAATWLWACDYDISLFLEELDLISSYQEDAQSPLHSDESDEGHSAFANAHSINDMEEGSGMGTDKKCGPIVKQDIEAQWLEGIPNKNVLATERVVEMTLAHLFAFAEAPDTSEPARSKVLKQLTKAHGVLVGSASDSENEGESFEADTAGANEKKGKKKSGPARKAGRKAARRDGEDEAEYPWDNAGRGGEDDESGAGVEGFDEEEDENVDGTGAWTRMASASNSADEDRDNQPPSVRTMWSRIREKLGEYSPSAADVTVEGAFYWRVRAQWMSGSTALGSTPPEPVVTSTSTRSNSTTATASVSPTLLSIHSSISHATRQTVLDSLLPDALVFAGLLETVLHALGVQFLHQGPLTPEKLDDQWRAYERGIQERNELARSSSDPLRPLLYVSQAALKAQEPLLREAFSVGVSLPQFLANTHSLPELLDSEALALLRSLLLLVPHIDFGDESGRKFVLYLLFNALAHPATPSWTIPLLLNALKITYGLHPEPAHADQRTANPASQSPGSNQNSEEPSLIAGVPEPQWRAYKSFSSLFLASLFSTWSAYTHCASQLLPGAPATSSFAPNSHPQIADTASVSTQSVLVLREKAEILRERLEGIEDRLSDMGASFDQDDGATENSNGNDAIMHVDVDAEPETEEALLQHYRRLKQALMTTEQALASADTRSDDIFASNSDLSNRYIPPGHAPLLPEQLGGLLWMRSMRLLHAYLSLPLPPPEEPRNTPASNSSPSLASVSPSLSLSSYVRLSPNKYESKFAALERLLRLRVWTIEGSVLFPHISTVLPNADFSATSPLLSDSTSDALPDTATMPLVPALYHTVLLPAIKSRSADIRLQGLQTLVSYALSQLSKDAALAVLSSPSVGSALFAPVFQVFQIVQEKGSDGRNVKSDRHFLSFLDGPQLIAEAMVCMGMLKDLLLALGSNSWKTLLQDPTAPWNAKRMHTFRTQDGPNTIVETIGMFLTMLSQLLDVTATNTISIHSENSTLHLQLDKLTFTIVQLVSAWILSPHSCTTTDNLPTDSPSPSITSETDAEEAHPDTAKSLPPQASSPGTSSPPDSPPNTTLSSTTTTFSTSVSSPDDSVLLSLHTLALRLLWRAYATCLWWNGVGIPVVLPSPLLGRKSDNSGGNADSDSNDSMNEDSCARDAASAALLPPNTTRLLTESYLRRCFVTYAALSEHNKGLLLSTIHTQWLDTIQQGQSLSEISEQLHFQCAKILVTSKSESGVVAPSQPTSKSSSKKQAAINKQIQSKHKELLEAHEALSNASKYFETVAGISLGHLPPIPISAATTPKEPFLQVVKNDPSLPGSPPSSIASQTDADNRSVYLQLVETISRSVPFAPLQLSPSILDGFSTTGQWFATLLAFSISLTRVRTVQSPVTTSVTTRFDLLLQPANTLPSKLASLLFPDSFPSSASPSTSIPSSLTASAPSLPYLATALGALLLTLAQVAPVAAPTARTRNARAASTRGRGRGRAAAREDSSDESSDDSDEDEASSDEELDGSVSASCDNEQDVAPANAQAGEVNEALASLIKLFPSVLSLVSLPEAPSAITTLDAGDTPSFPTPLPRLTNLSSDSHSSKSKNEFLYPLLHYIRTHLSELCINSLLPCWNPSDPTRTLSNSTLPEPQNKAKRVRLQDRQGTASDAPVALPSASSSPLAPDTAVIPHRLIPKGAYALFSALVGISRDALEGNLDAKLRLFAEGLQWLLKDVVPAMNEQGLSMDEPEPLEKYMEKKEESGTDNVQCLKDENEEDNAALDVANTEKVEAASKSDGESNDSEEDENPGEMSDDSGDEEDSEDSDTPQANALDTTFLSVGYQESDSSEDASDPPREKVNLRTTLQSYNSLVQRIQAIL